MPKKNDDLHGAAPDNCEVALLLVDVINPLNFPEAGQLLRYLPAMTKKRLAVLSSARIKRVCRLFM